MRSGFKFYSKLFLNCEIPQEKLKAKNIVIKNGRKKKRKKEKKKKKKNKKKKRKEKKRKNKVNGKIMKKYEY